mmetsp:Transcript_24464/g.39457  ORF Transcript_24464/g.39457 Transcript_24464/m.39457 type:complete len:209 (-) Transcript_24464:283-909(-)
MQRTREQHIAANTSLHAVVDKNTAQHRNQRRIAHMDEIAVDKGKQTIAAIFERLVRLVFSRIVFRFTACATIQRNQCVPHFAIVVHGDQSGGRSFGAEGQVFQRLQQVLVHRLNLLRNLDNRVVRTDGNLLSVALLLLAILVAIVDGGTFFLLNDLFVVVSRRSSIRDDKIPIAKVLKMIIVQAQDQFELHKTQHFIRRERSRNQLEA